MVVGTVAKSFAVPNEKLGVETPSDHRASDNIVVAVRICSLGYIKELTSSTRESSPEWSVTWSNLGDATYRFRAVRSASVRGRKPASTRQTTSCPLRSSMFDKVCWLRKFFLQN